MKVKKEKAIQPQNLWTWSKILELHIKKYEMNNKKGQGWGKKINKRKSDFTHEMVFITLYDGFSHLLDIRCFESIRCGILD